VSDVKAQNIFSSKSCQNPETQCCVVDAKAFHIGTINQSVIEIGSRIAKIARQATIRDCLMLT
jgi:hypothetical protein